MFEDFVAGRGQALQRFGYALTGDWALAEDLLQTALTRAYPRWSRIQRNDPAAVAVLAAAAATIPLRLDPFAPPVAPTDYHLSEKPPPHGARPGLIATGTIDGKQWRLTLRDRSTVRVPTVSVDGRRFFACADVPGNRIVGWAAYRAGGQLAGRSKPGQIP